VLLPESPDSYCYRVRALIPPGDHDRLGHARIVTTNFHGFLLRDRSGVPKVTRQVLAGVRTAETHFRRRPIRWPAGSAVRSATGAASSWICPGFGGVNGPKSGGLVVVEKEM
jgi:hypothetical protein